MVWGCHGGVAAADTRVAVALVADQVVGSLAGPTPPGRAWDRDGIKDWFKLGAVVTLAGVRPRSTVGRARHS
jgi:hypothetical protein